MMAEAAMKYASERQADFGLLFTVGTLPKMYEKFGWKLLHDRRFIYFDKGQESEVTEDIWRMYYPLSEKKFPDGEVNMQGNIW